MVKNWLDFFYVSFCKRVKIFPASSNSPEGPEMIMITAVDVVTARLNFVQLSKLPFTVTFKSG